ncbi:MAG TPA: carboxypeptidase-like regulatory domain-containing protein [Thermoanaerobaculia bacterium]|jgi:hypothetical protein
MFAAALILAASITGTVTVSGSPLPGVRVTLTQNDRDKTVTANDDGVYRIEDVFPGTATLRFELAGLLPREEEITVVAGENRQAPEELRVQPHAPMESIRAICFDARPESPWDSPRCADRERDVALIRSLDRGDRSVIALLRSRHEEEPTYEERHRIAGALLRHVPDDAAYWNELFTAAEGVMRERDPDFDEWCSAHDIESWKYMAVSRAALRTIASDPRSRDLLLRALTIADFDVIRIAIRGLAAQHDETAVPAIGRALDSLGSRAAELLPLLDGFESPAARRIARRNYR